MMMFAILLITGAAGAGKTVTADAWAASRLTPTAHLSHDTIMLTVKSGMVSPAEHVTAEADRQWQIAIEIAVATSQIYAAHHVRCVIDTFLLPTHLARWAALAPLPVGLVVLHPAVDVAVARNAVRLRDTGWGVPEWQVRANHLAMDAWSGRSDVLVLDTSALDQVQTVAAINDWETRADVGAAGGLSWDSVYHAEQ